MKEELVSVVRFSPVRDLFLRRLEPPRDILDEFLGHEQPPKDEAFLFIYIYLDY